MIKLIASDLDGTLLDDNKNLPPDFWDTILKLDQKGVLFTAASGRTMQTLKQDFAQGIGSMAFIASNGAVVEIGEQIIHISAIEKQVAHKIFAECERLKDVHLAVSSATATYMLSLEDKPWHEQLIKASFGKLTFVESLYDICDDIVQIAVCTPNGPKNTCYEEMYNIFSSEVEVVLSGEWWMDFMQKGVSKGKAVEILQNMLSLNKNQTMAFGDYNNDITLLQSAQHSYVMQNAPPHMRQYANFTAPSNNQNGVMTVINKMIL